MINNEETELEVDHFDWKIFLKTKAFHLFSDRNFQNIRHHENHYRGFEKSKDDVKSNINLDIDTAFLTSLYVCWCSKVIKIIHVDYIDDWTYYHSSVLNYGGEEKVKQWT